MSTGTLLIALVVLLGVAHLAGLLARRIGQPAVVGEVVAGVVLAPVIAGTDVAEATTSGALQLLATVTLVLFMFHVGTELDLSVLRRRRKAVVGVAAGSFVIPFLAGALLGFALVDWPRDPTRSDWTFVLFMSTATAATALPVLARILRERRLGSTEGGVLALSCAVLTDAVSWIVLAAVTLLASTATQDSWRVLLTIPFVVILVALRPVWRRLAASPSALLGGLLVAAGVSDAIGMHVAFGALLFGALLPRAATAVDATSTEGAGGEGADAEDPGSSPWLTTTITMVLPLYFVLAGTAVDLGTFDVSSWGTLGAVLLVAIGSKVAGTWLGATLSGVGRHPSLHVSILLNTRGLTEIVILQVGLQLGILDTEMFSIMVIMALVTTAMTGPALTAFDRWTERAALEVDTTRAVAPSAIAMNSESQEVER